MPRFQSVLPGLMSFLEEALVSTEKPTNPSEVQSKPHLPSDAVLGQLVTERIGLESGIVLSFTSKPQRRVRCCSLTAGSWSQHPQPHRGGSTVGGGSSRYWTVSLSRSLSSPLWTCTVASKSAGNSVSFHILFIHSLLTPHPLILEWRTPCLKKGVLIVNQ